MRRLLLMILWFLLFYSCERKNKVKIQTTPINRTAVNPSHAPNKVIYDSVIILFGDTAYKLKLHNINKGSDDETKANAILTLEKNQDGQAKILLKDSLYIRNGGYMEFKDFNNDHIKDLLIFNTTGGCANPTYYLYLVYPESHKLIRIKGFEKLANPEINATENIITSTALGGRSMFCSFYRITSKNKLINLGHSFEAPIGGDSLKFDAAIKKIEIENRRN